MTKNILWDFDGVILDSMHVRDYGFRKIFEIFPEPQVEKLIAYHKANGGWSRYVKIRYFYEEILNKTIDEAKVMELANTFSQIMKKELTNPKNIIKDALVFIKKNHDKFNFHIVSGSDEIELRYLCKALGIDSYFITINGSPTAKKELVRNVMHSFEYDKAETILIGDSINDCEAARMNNLGF